MPHLLTRLPKFEWPLTFFKGFLRLLTVPSPGAIRVRQISPHPAGHPFALGQISLPPGEGQGGGVQTGAGVVGTAVGVALRQINPQPFGQLEFGQTKLATESHGGGVHIGGGVVAEGTGVRVGVGDESRQISPQPLGQLAAGQTITPGEGQTGGRHCSGLGVGVAVGGTGGVRTGVGVTLGTS
ncbi:MAG: hypothetical protein DCC75_11745 [Proteobacteria bacterium]|nr:MAG: hypothetical protein DCC75_11745 [Pseudomonadota bacterium]